MDLLLVSEVGSGVGAEARRSGTLVFAQKSQPVRVDSEYFEACANLSVDHYKTKLMAGIWGHKFLLFCREREPEGCDSLLPCVL